MIVGFLIWLLCGVMFIGFGIFAFRAEIPAGFSVFDCRAEFTFVFYFCCRCRVRNYSGYGDLFFGD